MAEAIFNKLAKGKYVASSAGLFCTDGEDMAENARIVLSEIRIRTEHKSVRLTAPMIAEYDVIVGLGEGHVKSLVQAFPNDRRKIFSFPYEVDDPYGCDLEEYRRCRDLIRSGVPRILEFLKHEKD